jgi:hypothetical protein
VRWSPELLGQRARSLLLLYLAVAHYGRGRGEWKHGEAPAHWPGLVDEAVRAQGDELESAWRAANEGVAVDDLSARLEPVLAAAARNALIRLYPETRVFA